MELSEVVNPHFAFPVVGVVLCAVLVFAFGFKSPVQPPSFDNFGEEKKPRKSKHKKKSHISDHLENKDVVEKSTTVQKQMTVSKQTAAKTGDKSPQPQKEAKNKAKKNLSVKQPPPDKKEISQPNPDNEDGWETVSISKKKKNKNKKECDSEPDCVTESPKVALRIYNEPAAVTSPVEAITVDLEVPRPQRSKKDKTGKVKAKQEADKQASIDMSDKENTPEPQKQQEIEKQPSIDMSDKENTPEPQKQDTATIIEITKDAAKKENKKAKSKPTPELHPVHVYPTVPVGGAVTEKPEKKSKNKEVAAAPKDVLLQTKIEAPVSNAKELSTPQSNAMTESKLVKSPKGKKDKQKKDTATIIEITKDAAKKENKKAKSKPTPELHPVHVYPTVPVGGAVTEKPEKKSKNKEVAAAPKDVLIQTKIEAPVSNAKELSTPQSNAMTESKLVKSPKGKKDKQKKEVAPFPVMESTCTSLAASKTVIISPSPSQSNVNRTQDTDVEVKETVSEAVTSSDVETHKTGAMPETTNGVTFDEMGDWQEAKPTKKRKTKARRDN